MKRLTLQIIAGILGMFLAVKFISGVSLRIIPGQSSFFGIELTSVWEVLILVGVVLGLVNFFIKPILKFVTTPIRIITFGLATLLINMFLIWIVDVFFPELVINGLIPLFWTSLVIWAANSILLKFKK